MAHELVIIDDKDELYRRVLPYYVTLIGVSSGAFKDKRKPAHKFSVDCAKLTTPAECLSRAPNPSFRLVGLLAETPRGLGFTVWHEPELGNDAHCNVEGENSPEKCDLLAAGAWPLSYNSVELRVRRPG
jgi:hypothetical protein